MMTILSNYLLNFFFATLDAFIYMDGYYKCRNQSFKFNVRHILIIVLVSSLVSFNDVFNLTSFRLIINYIAMVTTVFSITKTNIKKSMAFSTYLFVITVIIELIIVLFLTQFINYKEFLDNHILPSFSINIFYTLFLYLSFKINFLKSLIIKIEHFFNSSIKTDYLIIFGIIALNFVCVYHRTYFNGINITLIEIFVISLMIILFFLALKEKHKKESQTLKSEFLSQAINNYESAIKDYKILKHNLMNDFLAIKTSANDECQELINEKIKKYSKDYEWIDLVSETPSGIQGLLFLKSQQAKQKGINFEIKSHNISVKEFKFQTKIYIYLNDVLGILLDNSIDNSLNSKEKQVLVNISQNQKEIVVEIINKFSHDLNIDMLGISNYSTKKEKSGIGLNYIIKHPHPKVKISNKIVNDYFVSVLKLHI